MLITRTEVPRVIGFIRSHTHRSAAPPSFPPLLVKQQKRRIPFCCTIGLRHHRIHNETVPVFHQHMAQIAQFGFLPIGFPI